MDLRPVERFNREMLGLERVYVQAVREAMGPSRLVMLEALLRDGVNSYNLPLVWRRELDQLGRIVSGIARLRADRLDEIVAVFAGQQFKLVETLTPSKRGSLFSQAQQSTAGKRRGILANMVESLTDWLDNLQARLQAELIRLRIGGEDEKAAADRLLAEEIADGRASVWRHAGNTMAANSQRDLWTAATALGQTYYEAGQSQSEQRWRKQAVAAIDERTTNCCLRVHGQIQDLDAPFHLTGTPRYADYKQHAPFHDFCRTAEALHLEVFETVGITTREMRDAARAELEARERTGTRVEIHPANAVSRRG